MPELTLSQKDLFMLAMPVTVIADPKLMIGSNVDRTNLAFWSKGRFFRALAGNGGVTFLDKKVILARSTRRKPFV